MNKDPWEREWREMKGKVEKDLCPELGMDLFRGELFSGEYSSDLQVFGKDVFLRNMLQRILAMDLHFKVQMAPVFMIVPSSQRGLKPVAVPPIAPPDTQVMTPPDTSQVPFCGRSIDGKGS